MFTLALGGLSTASLPIPLSSVLDLGCGTGIWTRQFAAAYPSAQVLGVDLVPPPTENQQLPSNCAFIKGDVEKDWAFAASKKFDFIFARLLIAGIKDWPRLFRTVYDHLRPGGIFEVCEGVITFRANDDSITPKISAMMEWYENFRAAVTKRGLHPDAALGFSELARSCDFEVVQDREIRLFLDPDLAGKNGDIRHGALVADEMKRDLRVLVENLTEKGVGSEELAKEALRDMEENAKARGYHCVQ